MTIPIIYRYLWGSLLRGYLPVLAILLAVFSLFVFVEEVDWAVLEEGALTLEDILYRRLRCVWFEPQELMLLLPALTERAAILLEWDALEQTRQRIAFEDRLALDLAAVPLAD